jgi:hypothetical protein
MYWGIGGIYLSNFHIYYVVQYYVLLLLLLYTLMQHPRQHDSTTTTVLRTSIYCSVHDRSTGLNIGLHTLTYILHQSSIDEEYNSTTYNVQKYNKQLSYYRIYSTTTVYVYTVW